MSEDINVPIRMLVFTSPDCYACPNVERIVHKLVGTYYSDMCHISTVNVLENPKIAEKYHVMHLPTVMIDDEIVLQGLVTESDIRDLLWQRVTGSIMSRVKTFDTRKETLLTISKNSFDSIMNEEFIRPNIGDYIHVGVMQQMMVSLIALDSLVPHLLYQAGRDVGLYGVGTYLMITLNPDIGTEFRAKERFEEVIKGLVKYFSDNESINIPMKLAESAEIIKIENDLAILRIYGLASACGAPFVGEPLCHFSAGEMAGLIEALTGRNAVVHETKCIGTGHEFCEFEIQVSDERITRNIAEYQEQYVIEDRNQHFQGILHDISTRLHESFISPKDVFNRGNIGNEVHFTKLQQAIVNLKMTDPFSGSLLYAAGMQLGIFGPGRDILQRYLEDENYSWPLNLKQALYVLNKFFHFGMIQAAKERADVAIIEDGDELKIRVFECAMSSGAKNSGTTFCDFMAGYLAGRIQILTSRDCVVTETKCHGLGDKYCEFEISFVDE
ncbi:MAG: V4R domain-containing protein [Candidatus Heimdallarchaeota archaeon]|nr:thioredoxin family protein [Candidatus Heimdallarchaeota archaeon]